MTELVVFDDGRCGAAERLTARLTSYARPGERDGTNVRIRPVLSAQELENLRPDVLLVAPDSAGTGIRGPVSCGILILPGDADLMPGVFEDGYIVTYGMSPQNTVTYSSIGEDSCVVALQRELVTVGGNVLERQEIKIEGGMHPDLLLAAASAAFTLGLSIEMNP